MLPALFALPAPRPFRVGTALCPLPFPAQPEPASDRLCLGQNTSPRRLRLRRRLYFGDAPSGRFRVLAVVDDFRRQRVPVFEMRFQNHRYPLGQVSHGDMVSAVAVRANPELKILRYQTSPVPKTDLNDVLGALAAICGRLFLGRPLDAAGMSLSLSVPFERLRTDLGLPDLNPDNVHAYRQEIWDRLHRLRFDLLPDSQIPRHYLAQGHRRFVFRLRWGLLLLDAIARRVPVFVAAGNDGRQALNLFLLPKAVIGVGALDRQGHPAAYSGNNSLIRQWAMADYQIRPAWDAQDRLLGAAIEPLLEETRHPPPRPVDLPLDRLRWHAPMRYLPTLPRERFEARLALPVQARGTSLAVPAAAAAWLAGRLDRTG